MINFGCLLGLAHAETTDNGEALNNLTNIYLHESLGNSDQKLHKFDKTTPLVLQLKCAYAPCDNQVISAKFNKAIKTSARLKFVVSQTDISPDVLLVYTDHSTAQRTRDYFLAKNSHNVVDAEDLDCQLYYAIKDDVITNVKIVISADASELKQQACMAIQMYRGMGLSLFNNLPFSKLWLLKQPDGYADINEADLTELSDKLAALSFIHMCPDLKAGMNLIQLSDLPISGSICFRDLIPSHRN